MSLFNPKKEIEKLWRALIEHRHTGLDSKRLNIKELVEAEASLTAKDSSPVDGTYGADEAAVIENTRTRVVEIENALKEFGILE